jgi:hypothetical protein
MAVHVHVAADAVTITLPKPPSDEMDCVVGDIEKVHGGGGGGGGGAACDTVNVCPPIVSVPVLAAPVFAAAANATVPLPVPDAPPVSVSHGALAVAVHAQVPADAVTATEPEPPVSATLCPVGEIVNVQGAGGAACVTVNVFPAAVIVALRALPMLAATVNATFSLPAPCDPPVMLTQGELAVAVQMQLAADAVTAIEPDPPASVKLCVVGDMEKVHGDGAAAA